MESNEQEFNGLLENNKVKTKKVKRKNLYTETGEPKRIRCYWGKRGNRYDPITVVYTYANYISESYRGCVIYSGYTECGICSCTDETTPRQFCGCGSIVKFSDLPLPCQEAVREEYKDFWGE
jgi:hypothetical protein